MVMFKYQQNSQVVARQVRGDCILVPVVSSEEALDSIYVLNETASFIWAKIAAAGCTRDKIVSQLVEEYEVTESQAEADVDMVLGDLVGIKAVERIEI